MGESRQEKLRKTIEWLSIVLSLFLAALFSLLNVKYSSDERSNALLQKLLPLVFCSNVAVYFVLKDRRSLFGKAEKPLYLLPCLLVAVNNFPFFAFITGKSVFVSVGATDVILFFLYCSAVGIFEECVFRGILFPVLLERFPKNKKGLLYGFVLSSIIFGLFHLFNLLGGAGLGETLLQVCYSALIGGLCAFALIKTKNILCLAAIHALYNFCGLLLDDSVGLGNGVVFNLPTVLITLAIGLSVGVFVLHSLLRYSEKERTDLYARMDI